MIDACRHGEKLTELFLFPSSTPSACLLFSHTYYTLLVISTKSKQQKVFHYLYYLECYLNMLTQYAQLSLLEMPLIPLLYAFFKKLLNIFSQTSSKFNSICNW